MSDEEHDGLLYKLQKLEGDIRGRDEKLKRFLQTALDAAKADPPFMPCVIERLEDSIKLLS